MIKQGLIVHKDCDPPYCWEHVLFQDDDGKFKFFCSYQNQWVEVTKDNSFKYD